MSSRIISLVVGLVLAAGIMQAQVETEGKNFPSYPGNLTENLKALKGLPLRVDNSQFEYFPPIIDQIGWSCNQASSIGYMLSYELNRKRELAGELPENQYSPSYPWNFLSSESVTSGVSYFDTWEIVKSNGCPNILDFPYTNDQNTWMNGYEKYLRAIKNKVVKNYSISVGSPAGLLQLKTWLFNHNDSFRFGGLANIQIASSGMNIRQLPDDSYDHGKSIILRFGQYVGHALTIVGYNDQVQYDFNGDGLYTNNIDLNNDGEITLADYEVGALLVVNSWGKGWGDRGKAYLPYRLLEAYGFEGGIWNKSVHVVEVLHNYDPSLVMKLEMAHTSRNMIKVSVGCSKDPAATYPDYIHDFPMLNYHGGETSLGIPSEGNHMEMGLDISPLLPHINANSPTKFFLMINERDPDGFGSGAVYNFSIYNYSATDTTAAEWTGQYVLKDNQTSIIDILHTSKFDQLKVNDYEMFYTEPDQWVSIPLGATGAKGAASWEVFPDYKEDTASFVFPEVVGEFEPFYLSSDGTLEFELPFEFPFYGEGVHTLFTHENGNIYLEEQSQDYPYSVDKEVVFKQRKAIVPFGQNLTFGNDGEGVYFEADEKVAKIFYVCQAQLGSFAQPFKFATFLYADGLIEFYYSAESLNEPQRTIYRSGLSKGNGKQVLYTTPATLGWLNPNSVVRLEPYRIPPKTKIEGNNYLLVRPEELNQNFEIRLKVSDQNYQEAYGTIPLSTLDFSSPELSLGAFPNPFVEETFLQFVLEEDASISAQIYSVQGQLIKSYESRDMQKGLHQLRWDGRSTNGGICPAGVYLVQLQIGDLIQSTKIVKNAW